VSWIKERLRRLLPTREVLQRSRWLRWLGPALYDPRLWHITRRGVAMGMAAGVFFGMLIPIAQIPLSAAAAIVLRANVPVAIASTLVSNPFTFPPIYYAAWRLGTALLGERVAEDADPPVIDSDMIVGSDESWLATARRQLSSVGRPLLLGLGVFAVVLSTGTYLLVMGIWHLKVVLAWRWRKRRRGLRG